jgi:hypothetical protein
MSPMKTNTFKTIKIFIYITVEHIVLNYVGENLTFVHRTVGVICVGCIDVFVVMELKLHKIKSFHKMQWTYK